MPSPIRTSALPLRRYEFRAPRDGIPLDVVAALELLPIWRRNERHGHTVPAAVTVCARTGQNQEVLGLGLCAARPRVQLGKGVVGHGTAALGTRVRNDGNVLVVVVVLVCVPLRPV